MGDTGAGTEAGDDLACPGWDRHTRTHTQTYTLYLHREIERGEIFCVFFCLLSLHVYGVIFCYYFLFL